MAAVRLTSGHFRQGCCWVIRSRCQPTCTSASASSPSVLNTGSRSFSTVVSRPASISASLSSQSSLSSSAYVRPALPNALAHSSLVHGINPFTRNMSAARRKIVVKNPIVELDGDEVYFIIFFFFFFLFFFFLLTGIC